MNLKKVDAHHHLWDLELQKHSWLVGDDPEEAALLGDYNKLKKSYLISDYLQDIKSLNIVKSVHVQAGWDGDPVAETAWLQDLADLYGFPHGIVAYADLTDPQVEEILARHCQYPNIRGIRQLLRGSAKDYLENSSWRQGYSLLKKYNLSFDLQIYPEQIAAVIKLLEYYPNTQVIINHTGMPANIADLTKLAEYPNVALKLSGFGMIEHDWDLTWLRPYVLRAIEIFGVERCMFASNFPVAGLYSSCKVLYEAFSETIAELSQQEQEQLFYDNAARIYRL